MKKITDVYFVLQLTGSQLKFLTEELKRMIDECEDECDYPRYRMIRALLDKCEFEDDCPAW